MFKGFTEKRRMCRASKNTAAKHPLLQLLIRESTARHDRTEMKSTQHQQRYQKTTKGRPQRKMCSLSLSPQVLLSHTMHRVTKHIYAYAYTHTRICIFIYVYVLVLPPHTKSPNTYIYIYIYPPASTHNTESHIYIVYINATGVSVA